MSQDNENLHVLMDEVVEKHEIIVFFYDSKLNIVNKNQNAQHWLATLNTTDKQEPTDLVKIFVKDHDTVHRIIRHTKDRVTSTFVYVDSALQRYSMKVFPSTSDLELFFLTMQKVIPEELDEDLLSRQYRQIMSTLNCLPFPVITLDQHFGIIDVNNFATEKTGWKLSEVYRSKFYTKIQEEERSFFFECDRATCDPHELLAIEENGGRLRFHVIKADKSSLPVEAIVTSHNVDDYRWYTVFLTDVSEIQSTELDLKNTDELASALQTIIQKAGIYLFIKDKEGSYLNVNDDVITDFPQFDFLHKLDKDIFEEKYVNYFADIEDEVLNRGMTVFHDIDMIINGEMHYFIATSTPRRDTYNNIVGLYALVQDVTAYKKAVLSKSEIESQKAVLAQQLAEESSRLKSDFLASMSHEIRTPLNGIVGMLTLLEYTTLDEQQKDYVISIRQSAGSLLSIVNDILDFSKIEAGKTELEYLDMDISALLDDVYRSNVIFARQKGLVLRLENNIEEEKRYILGDYGRLRQILNNLLNNALKFTFTGHVIIEAHFELHHQPETSNAKNARILSFMNGIDKANDNDKVLQHEGALRVSVSDTGIGISEDKLSRLFLPFTQAEESTSRRFGGTGLGLSICYSLVKLMKGEIGVVSTEGQGSTFWFTVPFFQGKQPITVAPVATHRQDHDHDKENASSPPHKGKNILVVEDNPMNRKVAIKLAEHIGYEAQGCDNGYEALQLLQMFPTRFGLVLMDLFMPVMNGYQATEEIRKLPPPLGNIAIVAMTANVLKGEREKCLSLGMDDYIAKPVNADILYDIIDTWMGKEHGFISAPSSSGSIFDSDLL